MTDLLNPLDVIKTSELQDLITPPSTTSGERKDRGKTKSCKPSGITNSRASTKNQLNDILQKADNNLDLLLYFQHQDKVEE